MDYSDRLNMISAVAEEDGVYHLEMKMNSSKGSYTLIIYSLNLSLSCTNSIFKARINPEQLHHYEDFKNLLTKQNRFRRYSFERNNTEYYGFLQKISLRLNPRYMIKDEIAKYFEIINPRITLDKKVAQKEKYVHYTSVVIVNQDEKYLHFNNDRENTTWSKMIQTKKLKGQEYLNSSRTNHCYAAFVLAYTSTTLSDIQEDADKLIYELTKPAYDEATNTARIVNEVYPKGPGCIPNAEKLLIAQYPWRDLNGRNGMPDVVIAFASDIQVNRYEFESMLARKAMRMLPCRKKQEERQSNWIREDSRKQEEERAKIEIESKKRKAEEEKKHILNFNARNICPKDAWITYDKSLKNYLVRNQHYESIELLLNGLFVYSAFNDKSLKNEKDLLKRIELFERQEPIPNDTLIRQYVEFRNNVALKPYRTEWAVYSDSSRIAGKIDMVSISQSKYILFKITNHDGIIENGALVKQGQVNANAKYPICDIKDSLYFKYAFEYSLYKYILEQEYDMLIDDIRLGVFCYSNGKAYVVRLPYLISEVKSFLASRNDILF